MLFECPVAKLCWWASPWQFKIDSFIGTKITCWFGNLLGLSTNLSIPEQLITEDRMMHYTVVVLERIWMERNQICLGGEKLDWNVWAWSVCHTFTTYWNAATKKKESKNNQCIDNSWKPPVKDEIKINIDAAFF